MDQPCHVDINELNNHYSLGSPHLEISDALVSFRQRIMHLLESFTRVISSSAFRFNVIEEVPDQVHLWDVPAPLFVLLRYLTMLIVTTPFKSNKMTHIYHFRKTCGHISTLAYCYIRLDVKRRYDVHLDVRPDAAQQEDVLVVLAQCVSQHRDTYPTRLGVSCISETKNSFCQSP